MLHSTGRTRHRTAVVVVIGGMAAAVICMAQAGRPSATALEMTAYRAIGAKHPDDSIRNGDQLAERLLGPEERAILKETGSEAVLAALAMDTERAWASLGSRSTLARAVHVRTRHIDSVLEESLRTGTSQVVNLGAGLDSRAIATMHPAAQSNALFAFHSNPWLNLHHFARASARGGPAPTGLSEEESRQWAAGVELYKPYAARDLLRDDGMVDIKSALRGAENKTSLDGIEINAGLKATLERLMPIYQKHWWPEHDRANRAWIAAVQPLLERHGTALNQALARTYDTTWPSDPVAVDLSVTAGPNGAYTTGPPTHVTISSSEPTHPGSCGARDAVS